jgi:hypothetical protein
MATLTISDAARVTGVSRMLLYRYIKAGKLSRTPDGLIDTAELLRAGLMLQTSDVTIPVTALHDVTPASVTPETCVTSAVTPPGPPPARAPVVSHPAGPTTDTRGAMRRRIMALLREHPEGLTPAEMRTLLGVDRSLADTCLGMLRDGLVQRVERGRYVTTELSRHNQSRR